MRISSFVSIASLLAFVTMFAATNSIAQDAVSPDEKAATQLKVDDSEPVTDMKTVPTTKSKAQLKRPKVGFKTTVRPEDMKSYNRSESGDISAQ